MCAPLRALPRICSRALSPAPCLHRGRPAITRRLPPPGPHLAPPASQPCTACSTCAPPRALSQSAVEPAPARCVNRDRPPPPARTSPRTACPPFDSRQSASAFNQPLSFDTTSVTSMYGMFRVRSSPCPAPNLQSSPAPHAACPAIARRLPSAGPHPRPAPHALLSTLGSPRRRSTNR